jgi:hypothetical protein
MSRWITARLQWPNFLLPRAEGNVIGELRAHHCFSFSCSSEYGISILELKGSDSMMIRYRLSQISTAPGSMAGGRWPAISLGSWQLRRISVVDVNFQILVLRAGKGFRQGRGTLLGHQGDPWLTGPAPTQNRGTVCSHTARGTEVLVGGVVDAEETTWFSLLCSTVGRSRRNIFKVP